MALRFFLRSISAKAAPTTQRVTLTPSQIATYERDGFLRVPDFFTRGECAQLMATVEADRSVESKVMPMTDASGRESKLTLWFNLGTSIYSRNHMEASGTF